MNTFEFQPNQLEACKLKGDEENLSGSLLEALTFTPIKIEGHADNFDADFKITMNNGDVIEAKYACPQNLADEKKESHSLAINGVDMSMYLAPTERTIEDSIRKAYIDFLLLRIK